MALKAVEAYALAKKYTEDSMDGAGAVRGVPCQIQSITPITGGNRITFSWLDNAGTTHTSTMDVMDGAQGAKGDKGDPGEDGENGLGIKSVTVDANDHLIVTYDDDTTQDAGQIQITAAVDSVNGKTGAVTLDASDVGALPDDTELFSGDYDDLTNKPTLFSGDYDDLTDKPTLGTAAAKNATGTITAGSRDLIESGAVASALADKADADDIPTKTSELTNDSNFVNTTAMNTAISASASSQEGLLKDTVGWTGKNLLKNTVTTGTSNGVTFTVNADKSITANGTGSTGDSIRGINFGQLPLGTYVLSGVPSGGGSSSYDMRLGNTSDSTDTWGTYVGLETGNGFTFTVTDASLYYTLALRVYNGFVANNVTFYPMIRRADIVDDTYEPYHESVETMYEEEIHGVNLLKITASTKTINGVTFTVNANKTITANGTAIDTDAVFFINSETDNTLSAGNYIFTANTENYGVADSILDKVGTGRIARGTIGNAENEFSINEKTAIRGFVRVFTNKTVSNFTFSPVIRKATIEDSTYRPYNEQAIQNQINAQGVLGAKNLFDKDSSVRAVNTYGVGNPTEKGIRITNSQAGSWSSVSYNFNLPKNTDIKISTNITVISGGAGILFRGSNDNGANWTTITDINNDAGGGIAGKIKRITNTGSYDLYRLTLYASRTTSELGDVLYDDLMVTLASDPDDTYVPYAMTNRELTEVVKVEDITRQATLNTDVVASGSIKVLKYGKLVIVTGENIVAKSQSNDQILITGLPLANIRVVAMCMGSNAANTAQIVQAGEMVFTTANSDNIKIHTGSAYNLTHWFDMSYITN